MVIKEIYQNQGISRGQIWDRIHKGPHPSENSPEADLYRYLIRELSTGGVIRQEREVNEYGQFMKRPSHYQPKATGSKTMESAFEETKSYVLTELGKQFVHYVMTEIVPQIADKNTQP